MEVEAEVEVEIKVAAEAEAEAEVEAEAEAIAEVEAEAEAEVEAKPEVEVEVEAIQDFLLSQGVFLDMDQEMQIILITHTNRTTLVHLRIHAIHAILLAKVVWIEEALL